MTGFKKATANYHSNELNTTLDIRYKGARIKQLNPKLKTQRVYSGIHNVNQDGMIIENGKRKLYVRTFDDKRSDALVKKTGIHRDYKGNYIMNVKNKDVKDYNLITRIIDKALRIK